MKKLTTRLIIALLTFVIGIAAVSVWFVFHRAPSKANSLLSGPPCRDGLVSVESQPDVPLRISISESVCENPQMTSVHFMVENVSSEPISKYEIRSIETYGRIIDDGGGVTTEGAILQPHQKHEGFIGGGVLAGVGGVPVGELKSYKLAVWSVTFADGTTWSRPSSQ